jgi:hypothetical protein
LAKLGVTAVELSLKGEGAETTPCGPVALEALAESVALCRITNA